MARARLTRKEADFVRKSRVVRVATADEDGRTHNVPVCAQWDGGALYFATGKNTRKVRNLRKNPSVSVVADQYSEDWGKLRAVVINGEARILGPGEEFKRFRQGLLRKYEQYRGEMAPSEDSDVIITVWPMEVMSWGLD